MVDWTLARQIARFAAGGAQVPQLGVDLNAMSADAERQVAGYTSLALPAPPPPPEMIDRATWADINLDTLSSFLDPVGERLSDRLGSAGPLSGPLRAAAGATLAAEVGLVAGYMSQRVLGQYELSLLQPEQPARLLFVGPNLVKAIGEMSLDRDSFLAWIVFHEVTHVFQLAGVEWLRPYLADLLREYLETVEVSIQKGAAGGLPSLPNASQIAEAYREGGLAALVQSKEQRGIMRRLQAVMAVVEGYSEHVMDAVGERVLPGYEKLRDAMDRRRQSRSAPQRILERLLGLDLKMRQYVVGKEFCDAVVQSDGIATLNRVWEAPELLPTLAELDEPGAWVSRIRNERAAA
jgi:coenzyme F420 biosynthesis associated uncharacterized protein